MRLYKLIFSVIVGCFISATMGCHTVSASKRSLDESGDDLALIITTKQRVDDSLPLGFLPPEVVCGIVSVGLAKSINCSFEGVRAAGALKCVNKYFLASIQSLPA